MSQDPLNLSFLEPAAIQKEIDARDTKKPSALEQQKEARLAEKEKRLTQKATVLKAPSDAPPVAPNPDTEKNNSNQKSVWLDKIAAYRERFPHLKKRNNVSAKSTKEEILDELHYVELQLGNNSSKTANAGALALTGAMHGLETLTRDYWNPLGLDLTGLGGVTQQNMMEFQPILDEIMIKHGAGLYTGPEWRLALTIGATVMTVHAANKDPAMAKALRSMKQQVDLPKTDL